jgi:TrmH family RNA methyltransferase
VATLRTLTARNPHLVRLGRLSARRRARDDEGAFVVDGPVLVAEALDAGLVCTDVFVDPDRLDGAIRQLVDRATDAGAEVYGADAAALRRATDPVTPQAVAAIVERPFEDPTELQRARSVLVLAEVADPGNAGTLVRAAAASGVDLIVTTAGTVDLFAPKTVRASAGAVLHLPTLGLGPAAEVLAELEGAGLCTVATVVDGGEPYDRVDLAGRIAIVLGNEAHGLDPEVVALAAGTVSIPMDGPAESLNVAMAGTLVCFEALRQRRARSGAAGDPITPSRTGWVSGRSHDRSSTQFGTSEPVGLDAEPDGRV